VKRTAALDGIFMPSSSHFYAFFMSVRAYCKSTRSKEEWCYRCLWKLYGFRATLDVLQPRPSALPFKLQKLKFGAWSRRQL
jgi:hypothetical protein